MPSIHEYLKSYPQHTDTRANYKTIATNMVNAGYVGYKRTN